MKGRKENEKKMEKRISEILDRSPKYIKDYYYTLMDKSYTTKYVYIQYVLSFINFVKNELDLDINDVNSFKKIKTSNISYYITQLNGKDSIKSSRLYGVKTFFNYLINDGYISVNPCDSVAKPKDREDKPITSLDKNEIEIVKNNIMTNCGKDLTRKTMTDWAKRDYAIFMIGLSLGLRVTSLIEIDINDIDFDKKEIKVVEKGNKTRSIMFGSNIESVLKEWIQARTYIVKKSGIDIDALFISNRVSRMSVGGVEKMVSKYTYNINKRITPHKLRSTCATTLYNASGDIYLTADRLGHRNVATTRKYAKISEERKKKAADAMDDILF